MLLSHKFRTNIHEKLTFWEHLAQTMIINKFNIREKIFKKTSNIRGKIVGISYRLYIRRCSCRTPFGAKEHRWSNAMCYPLIYEVTRGPLDSFATRTIFLAQVFPPNGITDTVKCLRHFYFRSFWNKAKQRLIRLQTDWNIFSSTDILKSTKIIFLGGGRDNSAKPCK